MDTPTGEPAQFAEKQAFRFYLDAIGKLLGAAAISSCELKAENVRKNLSITAVFGAVRRQFCGKSCEKLGHALNSLPKSPSIWGLESPVCRLDFFGLHQSWALTTRFPVLGLAASTAERFGFVKSCRPK
jgi:hypothetical protein